MDSACLQLASLFFHLLILSPLAVFLTVGCGVCDTSSAQLDDIDADDNQLQSSESRDSTGYDINPAISPVYEKNGLESSSDWNLFGESFGQFSWWNAKILGGGNSKI